MANPFSGKLDRTAYVDHTNDLADYLTQKTAKHSAKLVDKITTSFKTEKDLRGLKESIAEAKKDYKGVFKGMKIGVRNKLATAMYEGAEEMTAGGKVRRAADRIPILDGLTKNVEFYSEAYFRRIVEPKIKAFIVSHKGSPTFKRDLNALLKRSFLESDNYWKHVADTVAGRSYNYGLLKGAKMRGHSKFMLIAVVDERTTPFCRSIDGKTFYIKNALEDIEELAALRGKDVMHGPWSLVSEGKTSSTEMKNAGFTTPPFHSNCRTRCQVT